MNIFQKIKAKYRLEKAIRQADKAHEENGDRYLVLPTYDGILLIVNRLNFRFLKRKHYISEKATMRDALNECFYFTAHRDGNGAITPEQRIVKRRQYYRWCIAMQQLKKKRAGK